MADRAVMSIEPDVPDTRKIFVKAGRRDTLAAIAARNQVSVAQIKMWNDLRQDKLVAGQRLLLQVPYRLASATAAAKEGRAHRRVAAAPARRVAAVLVNNGGRTARGRAVAVRQVGHKQVVAAERTAKKPRT